ncbi:MAG: ComF family protein [Sterolibacterium sp.]
MTRQAVRALLPQDCFLCQAFAGTSLLCHGCSRDLPKIPATACPVCGLPAVGGETCGACLSDPPSFDATRSGFRYAFPLDHLVQALKYRHHLVVAQFFAEVLRETATCLPTPVDLALALPLSEMRLRQRGFNQALEIARPLARRCGWPLSAHGYRRVVDTAPQTSLPWKERHRNVRGAFECDLDLTGKNVIVIDDVMTTGATLNEFAQVLKQHGAAHVTNLVAARAFKD